MIWDLEDETMMVGFAGTVRLLRLEPRASFLTFNWSFRNLTEGLKMAFPVTMPITGDERQSKTMSYISTTDSVGGESLAFQSFHKHQLLFNQSCACQASAQFLFHCGN